MDATIKEHTEVVVKIDLNQIIKEIKEKLQM